jgi:uncharacterized protein (UPF0332 family)/predicted nucleotidyltransferase
MVQADLLQAKHRALDEFLRRLKRRAVWRKIAKVILYGSVLRGEAGEESDIDVLLVGTGDLREVEEAASDVAFSVLLDLDQRVEPLVYCLDDFRSPRAFLLAVRREGKEVYSMPPDEMARREAEDLLELAQSYYAMARSLLVPESVRGAIDLAYNAAELCVRALLRLRQEELPKTHGGLVQKFSQILIKQEQAIPADVGRALNRALSRRSQSRYDPHAVLTEADARAALRVADRLLQTLETELAT